jgi:hypothetical protein
VRDVNDSLGQKLNANLDWHGARIKFLARFLVALITTRTVNLAQIACVFAGEAQPASHYERCRRFLKDFALPYGELARFIVTGMNRATQRSARGRLDAAQEGRRLAKVASLRFFFP